MGDFHHPTVLVGGTFDVFHDGHRELLETAFQEGHPVIGITSDELAQEPRERDVEDYETRRNHVRKEAERLGDEYDRRWSISHLTEKVSIAATADAEKIIVSPEPKTIERVEQINEQRQDDGLDELDIVVSDEVYAEDGERISATRIQNGEIDENGDLPEG